jgi:hypothetical protein
MKSPIQLKEKKFNCSRELKEMIPTGSIVNSFLFLTGELEFELLKNNIFVVSHTSKYVVYEFWRCMMIDPVRVANVIEALAPIENSKTFYFHQEQWPKYKDPFVRSAYFFLLNYYSSTGMISSGAFEERDSLPLAITRVRNFSAENFHIQFDGGKEFSKVTQDLEKTDFLFFPIGDFSFNRFEEGVPIGFEETKIYHRHVKRFFDETDKKCVLAYFKHPHLFSSYKDYNITMLDQYGRKIETKKNCKEMLIANFRTD